MSFAIEGRGIEKRFAKKRPLGHLLLRPWRKAERIEALRGVDIRVRRGEIVGLLGPNGAGKTTLLKVLCCLVLPDRGEARIDGISTRRENEVKRKIGLVHSDERSFYWRLTGRQNLRFFARLYDVPRERTDARIDELLRRVDMRENAERLFADYSSGMKQRMAIARALLHDPPILLMDEPTRSLDPASSLTLRRFIQEELNGRDGKTILLASHDLREVESLAHRVTFVVRGRVRQEGTVGQIKRWGIRGRRVEIRLDGFAGTLESPLRVVEDHTAEGQRRLVLTLEDDAQLDHALRALLDGGARIRSVHEIEPDLEQAFSRILEAEEEPA